MPSETTAFAPPVLPAARAHALAMLSDADASMTELARVIKGDPGLTTSVLHAANTVASGARVPIKTAVDAIVRIGLEHTKQIVGSAVLGAAFEGLEESGLDVDEFWRHSIATAAIAEVAVDQARLRPLAFTSGLLHDVGRLVLAQRHPDGYRRVVLAAKRGAPASRAERVIFRTDHAEVGAAAARHWGLDDDLALALADHHGGTENKLSNAVFRARNLLLGLNMPDGLSPPAPLVRPANDPDADDAALLRLVGGKSGLDARVAMYRTAATKAASAA